jgi:LAS superfamily LD-carboxypeptidase LdcB
MYCKYRNERQLTLIKLVNAEAYNTLSAFIKDIEIQTDWKVLIVSGYRDEKKQAILKRMNPKNASPGKSKHNFGKAIDISVFKGTGFFPRWLVKSSSKKAWEDSKIPIIAQMYKLQWGGNFKNYHDPVHFEVDD